MKKATLFALTGIMALSLVPGTSQASHCSQIIIFSGAGTAVPANPALSSDRLNAGTVGCLNATTSGQEALNTDYLTPGATKVSVGVINYPRTSGAVPSLGKISFNGGAPVELDLTWSASSTRWNSQVINIPSTTTTVTASASVDDPGLTGYKTQSITYKKVA